MVHYIEKTGFLEVRDFWLEIVFGDLHGNRTLQVASPRFFTLPKALVPTGVASTTAAGTPRLNLRLAAAGAPTNFMAGSPSVT